MLLPLTVSTTAAAVAAAAAACGCCCCCLLLLLAAAASAAAVLLAAASPVATDVSMPPFLSPLRMRAQYIYFEVYVQGAVLLLLRCDSRIPGITLVYWSPPPSRFRYFSFGSAILQTPDCTDILLLTYCCPDVLPI